jgi:hypothetical protein
VPTASTYEGGAAIFVVFAVLVHLLTWPAGNRGTAWYWLSALRVFSRRRDPGGMSQPGLEEVWDALCSRCLEGTCSIH